jgi:hypothetical protein
MHPHAQHTRKIAPYPLSGTAGYHRSFRKSFGFPPGTQPRQSREMGRDTGGAGGESRPPLRRSVLPTPEGNVNLQALIQVWDVAPLPTGNGGCFDRRDGGVRDRRSQPVTVTLFSPQESRQIPSRAPPLACAIPDREPDEHDSFYAGETQPAAVVGGSVGKLLPARQRLGIKSRLPRTGSYRFRPAWGPFRKAASSKSGSSCRI